MATRTKLKEEDLSEGRGRRRAKMEEEPPLPSYLTSGEDKQNLLFTSTGCALFDEALGGGPVLGRVFNLIGDSSSGKTLDAMEMCAQTLMRYPDAWARYAEAESAWDEEYARDGLGIPTEKMILNAPGTRIETVEQWYDDLVACLDKYKDRPGIYVLDSLDAISDDGEMEGEFNKASYGGAKPKAVSQLFRRLCGRLEAQNVLLLVISQTRDAIGVMFGPTKTRSGGKALQFYSTHVVWLREAGKLKKTISGVERTIGLDIEAHCTKNKIGLAFRKAQYPILFGYGIDDLTASAEWLCSIGRDKLLHPLGMRKKTATRAKTRAEAATKEKEKPDPKLADLVPFDEAIVKIRNAGGEPVKKLREELTKLVRQEWARIETEFLPKARKY